MTRITIVSGTRGSGKTAVMNSLLGIDVHNSICFPITTVRKLLSPNADIRYLKGLSLKEVFIEAEVFGIKEIRFISLLVDGSIIPADYELRQISISTGLV